MERDQLNKDKGISKRPSGVFYIDGNKAFYFEQSLASPIPLDIPVDIISNIELLNAKKLEALLQAFIRSYKLVGKNIVLLLSAQITFDKDFPNGSIEVEKNIQEFLELVPFEEALDKKIISSGRTRVVAANREICESIKSIFSLAGFMVSGVYPLSLCLEVIPQLQSNLDLNLFVSKIPELKDFNLLPVIEPSSYNSVEKEKPNRNRMIMLVGVFALLLLILLFVIYTNIIAPPKTVSDQLPIPSAAPVAPSSSTQTVTGGVSETNPSTSSGQNTTGNAPTTGQK
jgi:hypothetical protein